MTRVPGENLLGLPSLRTLDPVLDPTRWVSRDDLSPHTPDVPPRESSPEGRIPPRPRSPRTRVRPPHRPSVPVGGRETGYRNNGITVVASSLHDMALHYFFSGPSLVRRDTDPGPVWSPHDTGTRTRGSRGGSLPRGGHLQSVSLHLGVVQNRSLAGDRPTRAVPVPRNEEWVRPSRVLHRRPVDHVAEEKLHPSFMRKRPPCKPRVLRGSDETI